MISTVFVATLVTSQEWVSPVENIAALPEAAAVVSHLSPGETKLVQEGNVLTLYYRQKSNKPQLISTVGLKLDPVEGTDGWVSRSKFPDLGRTMLSYLVVEGGSRRISEPFRAFYGSKSPRLADPVSALQGKIERHKMESKLLEKPRDIEVYFPPLAKGRVPVVYMADGQAVSSAAKQVERLILDGTIEPVALVGVYNGGYSGGDGEYDMSKDLRAKEYLRVMEAPEYAGHLKFFCDEVRSYVESHYAVRRDRAGRAVSGYSNGGAFALTAGLERPELFGSVFAYSVAAFDDEMVRGLGKGKGKQLPRYSFAAGELEVFIRGTKRADGLIKEFGGKTQLHTYQAGHDPLLWNYALGQDLRRTFPKPFWEKCF